jgi:hypothetical protein
MENSNEDSGMKVDPIGDSSSPAPQLPVDERLQKALDKALYAGGRPAAQKIRNFLNGTWLGEPLHVVLKDVPAGAWTVAMVFDLLDIALGVCREYVSTSLTLRWRYVEQHQNRERETGVTSWVAFLRPQGPFSQPMHGFSLLIP